MRRWIVLAAGALILGAVNVVIWQRETLLAEGRTVLLELAPVDPRSLMQGDYMALRFRLENDAFPRQASKGLKDGRVVVTLDSRGVGAFSRFEDATPLAANEARLRYRVRNERVKFATNAFFFQEGEAARFQGARYGELRVAADGEMLLTALRDEKLGLLGEQSR